VSCNIYNKAKDRSAAFSYRLTMFVLVLIAILIASASGCGGEATPTPIPTSEPQGKTVVTSTADTGLGTLRQALLDAQSGDTITFDPAVFQPSTPVTISLTSGLPDITQGNLTIDASNAGVILDGSNIPEQFVPALEILSDGNTIQGLQIVNFSPGAGIVLAGGAQNNTIGGDRSIGSGPLGQGNLVAYGDIGIGLWDYGTSFNTITGNLIGTDPTGAEDWGNDGSSIWISDSASGNTIGPDNVIAYNNGHGIEIRDSNSLGNTITQNSIHDNQGEGIYLCEGGNTELAVPFIFDFDLAAGTVTGTACANCTIEIFSDNSNQGEVYEGQATADDTGAFTFNKGASFTGARLTATATDADGNTGEFSVPTPGTSRMVILQEGNNLPKTQLQPKESNEIEDNRIGQMARLDTYTERHADDFVGQHKMLGLKWVRLSMDWFNWEEEVAITGELSRFDVDPNQDKAITGLVDNDIKIMYCLVFWDEAIQPEREDYSRFKVEDEIQRYLDYVQFIVHHFKDRIEYYEILNEPNIEEGTQEYVEVTDYINLVKRVVPVIREEYPGAKIVVGAVTPFSNTPGAEDYFFDVLSSDAMPLVDAVSWHACDGTSPEHEADFYYNIPSLVQEMKNVASTHGFTGEYIVEELHWRTHKDPHPYEYSDYGLIPSAKYYARGIVMYLGMNLATGLALENLEALPLMVRVIRNLSTIMAGAEPTSLPLEIQSEATNIRNYSFSLPNGDKLLALWTDGVAVDDDPGIEAALTLSGISAQGVTGIDVLNGYQQPIIAGNKKGDLVIENLIVRDYPLILHIEE